MNIKSKYHIGLSATYRRGWDEPGTNEILNYFGRALSEAEYTISEGISDGRLSQYSYYPFFATLEQYEFEDYYNLTIKISQLGGKNENENSSQLKNQEIQNILLNKRAEILKKAENKINTYKEIVKFGPKSPHIVFADDFSQLKKLKTAHKEIITELNKNSKIILKDDVLVFSGESEPWERKEILKQSIGQKTPIFAMYCLDEGIDVPEFNAAILVSSSRSKRQYIQRRGRILRIAKHEELAQLFDIVVFPPKQEEVNKNEIAIGVIKKEFERVQELSSDAINKYEGLNLFDEQKSKLGFV
jgi:superfamily II DNA or RNA helicase